MTNPYEPPDSAPNHAPQDCDLPLCEGIFITPEIMVEGYLAMQNTAPEDEAVLLFHGNARRGRVGDALGGDLEAESISQVRDQVSCWSGVIGDHLHLRTSTPCQKSWRLYPNHRHCV